MNLKEAIDRIEFEIEDDLNNKPFTIAGRMDIERIKQAKSELDTLNKGIDELLKKYENEITIYTESRNLVKEIITDLKKLKGE